MDNAGLSRAGGSIDQNDLSRFHYSPSIQTKREAHVYRALPLEMIKIAIPFELLGGLLGRGAGGLRLGGRLGFRLGRRFGGRSSLDRFHFVVSLHQAALAAGSVVLVDDTALGRAI